VQYGLGVLAAADSLNGGLLDSVVVAPVFPLRELALVVEGRDHNICQRARYEY